jgi:hypothetical protein
MEQRTGGKEQKGIGASRVIDSSLRFESRSRAKLQDSSCRLAKA